LLLFFAVQGFWNQDLVFAMQVLYHLSHTPIPEKVFKYHLR
jgi:hypothetical protein